MSYDRSELVFATNNVKTALFVLTLLLLPLGSANDAHANGAAKPENPWVTITDHDTDDDHGHILRASPFDGMTEAELAAVPRGNRVHWSAPSKCVPAALKSALNRIAAKYGPVTVNSTVRSKSRNRKIGGKRKSMHLKCAAVDFRVHGRTKGLLSYLSKTKGVGGYKRYKSGFYHIDTGPKRTW